MRELAIASPHTIIATTVKRVIASISLNGVTLFDGIAHCGKEQTMNDTRLAELRVEFEERQGRDLMEELAWGTYADHSGFVSKANGEFINWLCDAAYRALKGAGDE